MADTNIGKAYVQIIPKAEGITGQIENIISPAAEQSGSKGGASLGKALMSGLAKAGIVAGIGKLFKDSISEGANLQQSFGGFETIYGDAAEYAQEYAYMAAEAGISANDYAEQAVSFGAALKQAYGGDTAKAVEAANTAILDMTDNAAKMGTPLENIQNAYQGFAKQNYTMLDNLKLGYGGTKEEMQRLLEDASKLSGVEYNMDNLGDVYDAIHVIQEDLGLTGVAAEEASTTFSGSFGAMKAAAANVLGNLALGKNIGPSLRGLSTTIKTFLIDNALPMIGNVVEEIPTILAHIPEFIGDLLPDLVAGVGDIAVGLAQGIIDNIPVFVDGLKQMFSSIWTAITTIDWTAIGATLSSLASSAWEALKTAAQTVWDTIVGIFTGDVEFPDLSSLATTAWTGLVTLASNVWKSIKTWFTTTFSFPSLVEFATTAWNGLVTLANNVWLSIKTWFTTTFSFPSLVEFATTAWNGLVTLASNVWNSIKTKFSETFNFPSLDELATAAWETLTGIAGGIWDGIKGVFGSWGEDFSLATITTDTATAAWGTLKTAASTVWDEVAGVFGEIEITWPDFAGMAASAFQALKDAASDAWKWITGLFSGDEDDEAVKSVEGSTTEMAKAFEEAELSVSSVDVSTIQEANEYVKNTVLGWMNIFGGMSTWMILPTVDSKSMQAASQVIASWVTAYKRQMEFKWNLPTLHGKLPIISVTMKEATSSDGRTSISYPVLSAGSFSWFAKGGIFDGPQIIGVGESGPEAVVPLDPLWKHLESIESSGQTVINQTFYVDGSQDPEAWAVGAARTIKRELRMA